MPEPASESRSKKGRSPRYPGIPLEVVVQRAHALYEHEHKNWAPIDTIQEHWGFRPDTGPANGSIAAARQFGLIETEGLGNRRRARLTPLALEIILAEDSPRKFIRQAALAPELHRELWEQFRGHMPSDATLRRQLVMERNFTEHGAQEFISQFRKTIAFASLGEPDRDEEHDTHEQPTASPEDVPDPPPPTALPAGTQPIAPTRLGGSYTIPLLGSAEIQISGDFPISEAAWEQFMRVLEIYKPGLVAES